jgi:hypothetical protein
MGTSKLQPLSKRGTVVLPYGGYLILLPLNLAPLEKGCSIVRCRGGCVDSKNVVTHCWLSMQWSQSKNCWVDHPRCLNGIWSLTFLLSMVGVYICLKSSEWQSFMLSCMLPPLFYPESFGCKYAIFLVWRSMMSIVSVLPTFSFWGVSEFCLYCHPLCFILLTYIPAWNCPIQSCFGVGSSCWCFWLFKYCERVLGICIYL